MRCRCWPRSLARRPGGWPNVENVSLLAHGATRLGRYRSYLGSLDAHLGERRYDIVHAMLPVRRCDVYHPHAGLAAEAIESGHAKHARALHRTLAGWANRVNRKRRYFATVERSLLESAASPVVFCLSGYVKETIRRHFPSIPDSRLFKLFNAVDLARFNPERADGDAAAASLAADYPKAQVHALIIVQDFERKGLREAILAVERINNPRLMLHVVGKGGVGRYVALARAEGVTNQVRFHGPTSDPYPHYRLSDFFVLPTRHDPCSLVVLEALAMGLPVISTVRNGACEVMESGTHGYVLSDPGNVVALAEAMAKLMIPRHRSAIAEACLHLRPRLAYEHHLSELLEGYAMAMDRKS